MYTTTEKILSFVSLPDGWDCGRGAAPTVVNVRRALDVAIAAYKVCGFTKTNAFCGADGTISVTAYSSAFYLETRIEVDGTCSITIEKDDEEIFSSYCLSDADASQYILCLQSEEARDSWTTCALSILTTMMPREENLTALPYVQQIFPEKEREYRASVSNAPSSLVAGYANISGNIMAA